MLRSVIFQLSHQTADIPAALLQIYDKGYEQPSVHSLEVALLDIIDTFEHVFLVLDALDECRDKENLLGWIKQTSHPRKQKLHLLLSSRHDPKVQDHLRSLNTLFHVKFARDVKSEDIRMYVETKLARMHNWRDEIRTAVEIELIQRAAGM